MPTPVWTYQGPSFSVLFTGDPHHPCVHAPKLRAALDLARNTDASDLGPVALCVAGDLVEAPEAPGFCSWAYAPDGGGLDPAIPVIPCVGNHDTETPINAAFGSTPNDPHATFRSRFSALYGTVEWATWDSGPLRLMLLNNLTDYIRGDTGHPAYYNCNPPGADALNPDHGGISVANSPQRQWLDSVSNSAHPWKIIVCHRGVWAPFASDSRRLNRACRAAFQTAINQGTTMVVQGDQHIAALCGPWYPDETYRQPGQCGAYALAVNGGFLTRAIDETVLPNHEETCQFALGRDYSLGLATVARLTIRDSEVAQLAIFGASAADPTGLVLHETEIIRNPGC